MLHMSDRRKRPSEAADGDKLNGQLAAVDEAEVGKQLIRVASVPQRAHVLEGRLRRRASVTRLPSTG